jgi:hypothetical protein
MGAGERRYPLRDDDEEEQEEEGRDEEEARAGAAAGQAASAGAARAQPGGLTNCLRMLRLEYEWMQYEQAEVQDGAGDGSRQMGELGAEAAEASANQQS